MCWPGSTAPMPRAVAASGRRRQGERRRAAKSGRHGVGPAIWPRPRSDGVPIRRHCRSRRPACELRLAGCLAASPRDHTASRRRSHRRAAPRRRTRRAGDDSQEMAVRCIERSTKRESGCAAVERAPGPRHCRSSALSASAEAGACRLEGAKAPASYPRLRLPVPRRARAPRARVPPRPALRAVAATALCASSPAPPRSRARRAHPSPASDASPRAAARESTRQTRPTRARTMRLRRVSTGGCVAVVSSGGAARCARTHASRACCSGLRAHARARTPVIAITRSVNGTSTRSFSRRPSSYPPSFTTVCASCKTNM